MDKIQGEGYTARVEGKKLIIEIDLDRQGTLSKSGKSRVIASSRGNQSIGDVKLGLNVYRPV